MAAKPRNTVIQGFADPEKDLDHWIKHRDIITARCAGETPTEIARRMQIEVSQVYRAIRDAAAAVRESNVHLIEEMFLLQLQRLESMYVVIQSRINQMGTGELLFDDRVIRAGVTVLERQARLLDLDRAKSLPGKNGNAWLEGATPQEVIRAAEEIGLQIPESLKNATHTFGDTRGKEA